MSSYKRIFQPFVPVFVNRESSCAHGCPRCNASVFRVSRRFVDMFISLFISIRRYRCISMKCNWEGNLREKQNYLPSRMRTDLSSE